MDITLSGIDERTELSFISNQHSPEYAILLSGNPDGRNRYPSVEWIQKSIKESARFAVHICGSVARKNALAGDYTSILNSRTVDRIQVNGKVSMDELGKFIDLFPYTVIITQDCPYNVELAKCSHWNHQILIDGSGGRGIVRENWNLPEHLIGPSKVNKRIGFAGGLGLGNLKSAITDIEKLNLKREPWVDMETSLRNKDDWFDVEVASECVNIVKSTEVIF